MQTMTIEELAEQVGCRQDAIRKLIRKKELKSVRLGGVHRISKADANAWWRDQGGGLLFGDAGVGELPDQGESSGGTSAEEPTPSGDVVSASKDDSGGGVRSKSTSSAAGAEESSTAESDEAEDRLRELEKLTEKVRNSKRNKSSLSDEASRREKLASLRESQSSRIHRKIQSLADAEDAETAKGYFQRGYKAYKAENHPTALNYFEKAYEFDDKDPLYTTFYAYLSFLTDPDQRDRAQRLIQQVIRSKREESPADAHLFLGRILKTKDAHERAKKHFKRAVRINPNAQQAKRELWLYEKRENNQSGMGEKLKDFLNKDLF